MIDKHTPGPWWVAEYFLEPENRKQRTILAEAEDENGNIGVLVVADVSAEFDWPEEIEHANAQLISAAPDLLEALEHVLKLIELKSDFNSNDARSVVCKALNKAKGVGDE